jgi:septal ring factor EnvC (AmiA/AmiB activator)
MARNHAASEDHEENYFISMVDMLSGVLFIFLVLMIYFANVADFTPKEKKIDTAELLAEITHLKGQLVSTEKERDDLLKRLAQMEARLRELEAERQLLTKSNEENANLLSQIKELKQQSIEDILKWEAVFAKQTARIQELESSEQNPSSSPIVIYASKSSAVFVDSERVSLAELPRTLKAKRSQRGAVGVIIADKGVSLNFLFNVINDAKGAGLQLQPIFAPPAGY